MTRVLKTFLLWLLLAVLPLQGIAAAAQTSCGPMSHHDSSELVVVMQPHHHHDGDAAVSAVKVALAKAIGDSTHSKHKSAFCNACATCCVGAVAPPFVSVLTPVYSGSQPVVFSPAQLVTGFIPAGLERPPKRITA